MRSVSALLALLGITAAGSGNTYWVGKAQDSGPGSLRWAIEQANNHVGRDKILFRPALRGQRILLATPLPTLTDNRTVINGDINGDGRPDVGINGEPLATGNGLTVSGNYCTVSGLAITNAPKMGISVGDAAGCRILGCHIAVSLAGTKRRSSSFPNVSLHNCRSCQIGGGAAGQRNIIAGGNGLVGSCGIRLAGTENTKIANCYIGVARDGVTAFGGAATGIEILPVPDDESTGNTIGGSRAAGEGNVFGGLAYGVFISAGADNAVSGNNFGLAADGDTLLPLSTAGVWVRHGSVQNVIGGSSPDTRNAFAGRAIAGVNFTDSGTKGNKVWGNYFGTNVAGTGQRRLIQGVVVDFFAGPQTIGGDRRRRNYFTVKHPSVPVTRGIFLNNAGAGTSIRGNRIGVRPDGKNATIATQGVTLLGASAVVLDNLIARAVEGVIVAGPTAAPRIFRNTFRGCTNGVRITLGSKPLLGNLNNASTSDDGGNVFAPTNTYHIRNSTPDRIRAEGNDFGTTSRAAIDAKIYDDNESPTSGRVDFSPLKGGVIPTGGVAVTALSITSAAAIPAAGGAEIAFALSTPADVTVTVLNIAGRPVAQVARDVPAQAGTQRLVWSGRALSGTRAPAGKYLVHLAARSAEGEQRTALCGLNLP